MFNKACNLSDNERIIRMSLGLAILLLALYTLDSGLKAFVLILAVLAIVTGVVRYDPVYDLMNFSSKKTVHHQRSKKANRSHHR